MSKVPLRQFREDPRDLSHSMQIRRAAPDRDVGSHRGCPEANARYVLGRINLFMHALRRGSERRARQPRSRRFTRIAFTGSLSAILPPISTAGMFASIMPSVVPMTTADGRTPTADKSSPLEVYPHDLFTRLPERLQCLRKTDGPAFFRPSLAKAELRLPNITGRGAPNRGRRNYRTGGRPRTFGVAGPVAGRAQRSSCG
jgi:hypothetical protein